MLLSEFITKCQEQLTKNGDGVLTMPCDDIYYSRGVNYIKYTTDLEDASWSLPSYVFNEIVQSNQKGYYVI